MFYVNKFKIYTPCCTYFTITLRDICITFDVIFIHDTDYISIIIERVRT